MTRCVGIDYGRARIGVAVSDESKFLASPHPAIKAGKTLEESAKRLVEFLKSVGPYEMVVIGLPLHLSGDESPMSQEVRKFGTLLETTYNLSVVYWDERLTSSQATTMMKESNHNRKSRAGKIDSMAASLMLQSYLDAPNT
ncbi:MAG: putative pre-16S rRNA nuclease [Chlamydiia bacterium]|nr:putative pre-16S rRNA nuclease [Chlamydiia bacterium]